MTKPRTVTIEEAVENGLTAGDVMTTETMLEQFCVTKELHSEFESAGATKTSVADKVSCATTMIGLVETSLTVSNRRCSPAGKLGRIEETKTLEQFCDEQARTAKLLLAGLLKAIAGSPEIWSNDTDGSQPTVEGKLRISLVVHRAFWHKASLSCKLVAS